jgi:hypothetical protein
MEALGCPRAGNVAEDHNPQDPSVKAAHGSEGPAPDMPNVVGMTTAGDGSSAPEVEMTVVAEVVSSPTTDEVADQDPTASLSNPMASSSSLQPQVAAASASAGADNNIMEEPEAILGHPLLMALGDVSLDEAMDTVCWALNQAPSRERPHPR